MIFLYWFMVSVEDLDLAKDSDGDQAGSSSSRKSPRKARVGRLPWKL